MTVQTNNHARDVLTWWDLSEREREAFDWEGADEDSFFRYRGSAYALSEFFHAPESLEPWHGVRIDSFYSGIVIRMSEDNESIVVGTLII